MYNLARPIPQIVPDLTLNIGGKTLNAYGWSVSEFGWLTDIPNALFCELKMHY
jgi:hypothetical protein